MIFCKELNKSFETKEEMFQAIKNNLPEIMRLKLLKEYRSHEKGSGVSLRILDTSKISTANKLSFDTDEDHYYIAVNTTMVLDSHDDLHDNGIWDDSVITEQGKNYLVCDHSLAMSNVVVKKAFVEQFVATIPFAAIGKDYPGNTQALIYKFRKDKIINEVAGDWLESGDDIEASVRMQYEELEFALDSNAPDDKKYKDLYDKYLPKIANKSDFDYISYFFLIKKARNVLESSLVIAGSNPATGQIVVMPAKKEIDQAETSQKMKSSLLLT